MLGRELRNPVNAMDRSSLHQLRVIQPESLPTGRAPLEIFRPFFLAGILCVLTAGCLLGAIALFGIATKGNYTASAWTPYVWAHANSQLYGWVGFFIMGFALQMHGTTQAKHIAFHKLAHISLALMAAGIALRFLAEPMAHVNPSRWVPLGILACVLQLLAVICFLYNSGANRYQTKEKLSWQTLFVFASLGWLTLVAAIEPFFFAYSHQINNLDSVKFVAKWFNPYREVQFLGFVSMMIFGVALVKLHSCFGFKKSLEVFGIAGFVLWILGIVSRATGWLLYFNTNMHPGANKLYLLSSLFLLSGAASIMFALRLFEPVTQVLRSQKFIRAAFIWLLIAGVMMIFEPIHLSAIGKEFSHAYTGGIRHAVTVGFISQMIIGVSLQVVEARYQLNPETVPKLWATFALLNLGNCARVALEIATDYFPAAFMPMGFTGFIELTALILWAFVVSRPMLVNRKMSIAHAT